MSRADCRPVAKVLWRVTDEGSWETVERSITTTIKIERDGIAYAIGTVDVRDLVHLLRHVPIVRAVEKTA